MANATFLDIEPSFEIKDGLAFTTTSDGAVFAASIHTFRKAVEKANRALALLDQQPVNVFPICACCEKRPH